MPRLVNHYRFGGYAYLADDNALEYAYSVRLLDSAYSGALVRIRRSSDSAEKDFYPDANNLLSMSSDDGAGTTLSTWISTDSGYLAKWYNQGSAGSTYDLVQTTAANQPRIVNAGTLETDPSNGIVSVFFDSTNDHMVMSSSTTTTMGTGLSAMCVFNRASSGINSIPSVGYTAVDRPYMLWWNTSDVIRNRPAASSPESFSTDTSSGDFLYFMYVPSASTNVYVYLNGAADGSNPQTHFASDRTADAIGTVVNTTFHNGYIQETLYWNTDESASRTDMETNINDFYSIY